MNYLDFDVSVERQGTRYVAKVIRSPCGEADHEFDVPLSEVELRDFRNEVVRSRKALRGLGGTPSTKLVKEYGGRLYNALFGGEVQSCLLASLREVERQDTGLRIRLRFTDAPDLSRLPWEYAYRTNKNSFLALATRTPLVRYLDLPDSPRPLKVKSPIRVLVMISSPSDYPLLDTDAEWGHLREALGELEEQGVVKLQLLDHATLRELRWQLRKDDYHVFHYVGHGGIDPGAQCGVLVLEDEMGQSVLTSGDQLGVILHEEKTLRLAVLNACEGGRIEWTDMFSGVAQTLIQQDVPAVVAMQFEISDTAAVTFARDFYKSLAFGDPVDAAVGQARQAIFEKNPLEWGTPVLYMRASDGQLFTVDTSEFTALKPVAPSPAPPTPAASPTKPTETDLEQAQRAVTTGRWNDAIEMLQAILHREPGHGPAQVLLQEARQKKEVDALYEAGKVHLDARRYREALACFTTVRTRSGDYKDLAQLHQRARDGREQELRAPLPEVSNPPPTERSSVLGLKPWQLMALGGVLVFVVLAVIGAIMESSSPAVPPVALSGSLRQGRSGSHHLALTAGISYQISGDCDHDCTDIDLFVQDPSGGVVGRDEGPDDRPQVLLHAEESGTYVVIASMIACSVAPCAYNLEVSPHFSGQR